MSFAPPERLAGRHDVSSFVNGRHPELDDWLRTALDRETTARTFVSCFEGADRVAGYYALATGSVERARVPRAKLRAGLSGHAPVVLLARLAVDARAQRQGLGSSLLVDALRRAAAATHDVAAFDVVVHAIDEAAAAFYAKHGFLDLAQPGGAVRTMFLPLRALPPT
ncbi:MAG: GNAT family N-acetyltransferase [Tagaea sp.]